MKDPVNWISCSEKDCKNKINLIEKYLKGLQ